MVEISVAAVIRKRRAAVYEAFKEVEKFPSFLKDVKEISVRSSNCNRMVSDWKVDIDGTPIEWRQEMLFDETNHSVIYFKMLEGDYEGYEGRYLFEEKGDDATRVEIHAQFNWGVPGLERFVGEIFEEKARKSLKGMLCAMRKELQRK